MLRRCSSEERCPFNPDLWKCDSHRLTLFVTRCCGTYVSKDMWVESGQLGLTWVWRVESENGDLLSVFTLVVTGALLVVTRFASSNKCIATSNKKLLGALGIATSCPCSLWLGFADAPWCTDEPMSLMFFANQWNEADTSRRPRFSNKVCECTLDAYSVKAPVWNWRQEHLFHYVGRELWAWSRDMTSAENYLLLVVLPIEARMNTAWMHRY